MGSATKTHCGEHMDEMDDPSDLAELAVGLIANTFFRQQHVVVAMFPHPHGVGYCTTQLGSVAPEDIEQMIEVLDEVRERWQRALDAHDKRVIAAHCVHMEE